MSKEDIDRAVKDAERYAEEDKKKRDLIDAKNAAESMIFQTEKTLSDLGDKVTEDEKAPVKAAVEKLRSTCSGSDENAIKADTEALQKAFYPIAEKLYAQQQTAGNGQPGGFDPNANGGANGGSGFNGNGNGGNGDTYYNADFEDKTGK